MRIIQLILTVSVLVLMTACGQSYNQQEMKDTESLTEKNETAPTTETVDMSKETNEDTKDEENSTEDSIQDLETTVEKTEEIASTVNTNGTDSVKESIDTGADEPNTSDTELGVDEISPPSYTDSDDEDFQQAVDTLTNQFSNQLLTIQVEDGEDFGHVYAIITDGLKLPSDEEREFHVTQMAEAIVSGLNLPTIAPNGSITFVYEDQSVLATYHTESGTITW